MVGILTVDLLTGDLPISGNHGTTNVGTAQTPTPSNVVVVPSAAAKQVLGEIVYVKAGNIWLESNGSAHQVTSTGTDSMPSFSPDGQWIYYVETQAERGYYACGSGPGDYAMNVPSILRIKADGSGQPQQLATGRFTRGPYTWFYFLRQPVVSPDGSRLALVSDAPKPCQDDVVLQFLNLKTRRLTSANQPENAPLGHQDPAWSPDGRTLLYVKNDRSGDRGTPVVYRYVVATRKSTALTGPGYLQPAWSPDGRFVAVTHIDSIGSDIVILDATNGQEVLRLTTDDASAAPVWSPAGDAIAYLHTVNGVTDLQLIDLAGSGPGWTPGQPIALTSLAGLDPGSRPSWFIPSGELPASPTTPGASGTGAASGAP